MQQLSRRLIGALAPVLGGLLACSSDATAPQAGGCLAETASVNATVSLGTSVVFDWTPACSVALLVVESAQGHDLWWSATFDVDADAIPTIEANRITPPVTFGQVPLAATHSFGPDALTPGTPYILALWRILPPSSTVRCQQNMGQACLLAVKTFTR